MPTLNFTSVTDGPEAVVLLPGADTSDVLPACLTDWAIEYRDFSALTLMRAGDTVQDYGLATDRNGLYNQAAHRVAYNIGYALAHVTAVTETRHGTEAVRTEGPDRAYFEAFQPDLLEYFVRQARPGVRSANVKKPAPDTAPATKAPKASETPKSAAASA